ncbi:LOW QUALITY PROTEIN: trophoblast glycoprotein-like [Aplochiton taeniatus]
MTGNNIDRIGTVFFTGMENVTNLIISSNRITEVASLAFSALLNLRFLDLSCNQLALIHPEALSIPGSPLLELNLSSSLYNSTSITDLTTRWGSLGGLLRLDLSGNHLVLLPPGMFTHLPSLEHLLLHNNSLEAVYKGTFSGMHRLKVLDLTSNSFRTFRADAFGELGRLGLARVLLSNNPYTCICEIHDFVVWLNSSRAQVVDIESVTCDSPQRLQGIHLKQLELKDIGCLHNPIQTDVTELSLQTSYVLLGLVLGFVGMVFLFVLYLNRSGITKWIVGIRNGCQDVLVGYHYRYEIDSDSRLGNLSVIQGTGRFGVAPSENRAAQVSPDACLVQMPSDTRLKQLSISPTVDVMGQ